MAKVWSNLAGTTALDFSIGKGGPTVHQGSGMPSNALGADGHLYIRHGPAAGLFQKDGGTWKSIVPSQFVRQTIPMGTVGLIGDLATYVGVVTNTAQATTINLPTGTEGKQITVKDETGLANTANITVQGGTIDGTSAYVINTGYGSVTLSYAGGKWLIVRRT